MTNPSANRVLVCDDEKNMRRVLEDILGEDDWNVTSVASGEEVIDLVLGQRELFEAIVLDLSLPGMNGLDVLGRLRDADVEAGVVVITAYGSVDAAVTAMQRGAVDFLIKPFDNARIRGVLRKIRESRNLLGQAEMSHPTLVGADSMPLNFVGSDPRLQDIFRVVKQIASLKTSVLIHGESGTGKELVAQAIHYNGNRRHLPFVPVNCAALPETLLESEFFGHERGAYTGAHSLVRGKFELANGGTLFLDEVGDMPPSLQVKLLRVLQEQTFTRVGGEKEIEVDVRIIAATNHDLAELVRTKTFREDLFYRLNVIPIHLPPLRERREDIPQLVDSFLSRFAKRHKISKLMLTPGEIETLKRYHWPGNIRQLQNTLEKATVLQDLAAPLRDLGNTGVSTSAPSPDPPPESETVVVLPSGKGSRGGNKEPQPVSERPPDDFSLKLGEEGSIRELSEVAADAQRAAVIRALRLCRGNKSEAAKRLGVSYKTLFNKIDDLQIQISTKVE